MPAFEIPRVPALVNCKGVDKNGPNAVRPIAITEAWLRLGASACLRKDPDIDTGLADAGHMGVGIPWGADNNYTRCDAAARGWPTPEIVPTSARRVGNSALRGMVNQHTEISMTKSAIMNQARLGGNVPQRSQEQGRGRNVRRGNIPAS